MLAGLRLARVSARHYARRGLTSSTVLGSQVRGATADAVPVKRVLVSVFDKDGLPELCEYLASPAVGAEIVSTGGTAALLRDRGIAVRDVSELTGFPEILGGRVKSLHPGVHGGILAVRGNESHAAELAAHGIGAIDMVVGNLYPFEAAVAANGGDRWTVAENVDIGGPTMIRAAAKNHGSVAVVTAPSQYAAVRAELELGGGATRLAFRKKLAGEAFGLTARYEAAIADFFAGGDDANASTDAAATTTTMTPRVTRYDPVLPLKYGNNPHQKPAAICSINGKALPFKVLNGTPGCVCTCVRASVCACVRECARAGACIQFSSSQAWRV